MPGWRAFPAINRVPLPTPPPVLSRPSRNTAGTRKDRWRGPRWQSPIVAVYRAPPRHKTGAASETLNRPKISAFKGRTRNFVIPNVICRAGSSFAAASRGLILGFACFETYSLCFNVSSGLFFVCADSPPVLFTPADLLGPLPGRHRSQPFPGAEKISHPFVPA